jgi:hypothetical protein
MRGPLPNPNRRRRNAPTIAGTTLPAAGRQDVPPAPERLGEAGRKWWEWAWRTPSAAAWSESELRAVERRAVLEDWLEDLDDELETPKLSADRLLTQMLNLDDRLGLTPKSRAQLRWTIAAPDLDDDGCEDRPPQHPSEPRRLRAVDPAEAASG